MASSQSPSAVPMSYVSEIPILMTLLQLTIEFDPQKCSKFDSLLKESQHDINTMLFTAGKLTYLLNHSITIDLPASFLRYHKITSKKLAGCQTKYNSAVLTKGFLPHVKELIRKWLVENQWRTFPSLSPAQREDIWMKAWDANPLALAKQIFKVLVVGVLDLGRIFPKEDNVTFEDDVKKLDAVRAMLREQYAFGCKITYQYRVEQKPDRRDQCFSRWVKLDLADQDVSILDLPLLPTATKKPSSVHSKKRKRDVEEEQEEVMTVEANQARLSQNLDKDELSLEEGEILE